MSGRVLGLPRWGDSPKRAPRASAEETEKRIRQRLYGDRGTVQLLASKRAPSAPTAPTGAPDGERAVNTSTPAVSRAPGSR